MVINKIQDIKQKVETATCTRHYSHALHNRSHHKTTRIVIIMKRDLINLSESVCLLLSSQGCHYLFLSKDNFAAKWLRKNYKKKSPEKAPNLQNCQELHSFIWHFDKTYPDQKPTQPQKTVQQCLLKCTLAHHNTLHSFWECFGYQFQTSGM